MTDKWLSGVGWDRPAEKSSQTAQAPSEGAPGWERETLNKLLFDSLQEQRRKRRWGIFFRLLGFAYLFAIGWLLWQGSDGLGGDGDRGKGQHTALVEVQGIIADGAQASADAVVGGLRAAFRDRNTAAVVLRINSPGGSPVQAGYINDEIRRLRALHPETPLYAVISDLGASGGYYIAASADQIYVNESSLVGSIGVLMNGFGFVDAIDKLGIERRLMTAGEHKGFFDPFLPMTEADEAHIHQLLDRLHERFIEVVREGRGERLTGDEALLFSGLIWSGLESIELGLADGLGSASYVAREVVGVERMVDFTRRPHYLERMIERLGMVVADRLATHLGGQWQLR